MATLGTRAPLQKTRTLKGLRRHIRTRPTLSELRQNKKCSSSPRVSKQTLGWNWPTPSALYSNCPTTLSSPGLASLLYKQYRRHLGPWRYFLLLEIQALLVPDKVQRLLHLSPNQLIAHLVGIYGIVEKFSLQSVVHTLLIPPQYWAEMRKFDRVVAA